MLYKKDDFCGFIVTIESKTERKKKKWFCIATLEGFVGFRESELLVQF